jgi:hypothetical protein
MAWVAIIIGCLFIPSSALLTYWIAADFFSALFILAQAIILVDFICSTVEKWILLSQNGDKKLLYESLLVVCTILLYGFTLVLTAFLFTFYTNSMKPECSLNVFFITLNLILSILVSIVSVNRKVQNANHYSGLLQSAFITSYTTYLVASSLVVSI